MVTTYRSNDTEDVPATQDSPLDLVSQKHPMQKRDNESSDEYCEETDTSHHLVELLGQLCQLKD